MNNLEEILNNKLQEKAKKKRFQNLRNYFREYCVCSSIHGFRYFGEKRTYFERFWWLFVFMASMGGCGYLIREVYRKWEQSPVIVTFATRETPIYDIPFPAVTICPELKFVKVHCNDSDIFYKSLKEDFIDEDSVTCTPVAGSIQYDKDNFKIELLKNISFTNFISPLCQLLGKFENCSNLFKPIVLDEGVCLTFNTLDRSELFHEDVVKHLDFHKMNSLTYQNWSLYRGYHPQATVYSYPKRAFLSGANNALIVTLSITKKNLKLISKDSFQGFKIILHTPIRIPRASQDFFVVPFNQFVIAGIQPTMITTSESVKLYNAKRRDCYFPTEFQLRFFKVYTNLNCRLECLTNFTLQICGCVNFFMPHDISTKICGAKSLLCMKQVEYELQTVSMIGSLNKVDYQACPCMPMCTDLTYNVETSQSTWDWTKDDDTNYKTEEEVYRSKLVLYFKSSQFVTSQRQELYGPTDFLANFGGLLGLFTGFSVLSFMEIIYFLTVRLCCNVKLFGYWAGPE